MTEDVPDGHPEAKLPPGPEAPNPPLDKKTLEKIQAQQQIVKENMGQDFHEDPNLSTNTEPTPVPVKRKPPPVATEKDHYDVGVKQRVASELDEIHYVLGTFLHLQRHHRNLGTFNNTKGRKAFTPDGKPLAAKQREDRLLRELKRTDEIMEEQETGHAGSVPSEPDTRRPQGGAPPSLDAPEFGQYRAYRDAHGHGRLKTTDFSYDRQVPLPKKFQDIRAYHEWLNQDSVGKNAEAKSAKELGANPEGVNSQIPVNSDQKAENPVPATLLGESTSTTVASQAEPVFEYESALLREHYITTDKALASGTDKWTGGHALFKAFTSPTVGTYPIYVFWNVRDMDHRYATSPSPVDGEDLDGVAFYAYTTQVPGTVPLHEFYNTQTQDHIYSTDHVDMFAKNDKHIEYRGIIAYVLPLDAPAMHAPAHHAAAKTQTVASAPVKTTLLDDDQGIIH
eukprot:TRINITY_DN3043_c0_g1_i1.p2 TRINITY_DN3043_c0_g1~~TRINITY_DN3043_c0_g1_i1.p2  ORF type:complete len:452 (-),score=156.53 TRINITY_DN3043_c0_g1_i1:95-1450(-)